jgi:hypothetical protein
MDTGLKEHPGDRRLRTEYDVENEYQAGFGSVLRPMGWFSLPSSLERIT